MEEKDAVRFWSRVDKTPGGCWLWTGPLRKGSGYGHFAVGHKLRLSAHRAAWIFTYGPIPPGEGYHGTCVCHTCDVRHCVNPAHLFLGTQKTNLEDASRKGRMSTPKTCRKPRIWKIKMICNFGHPREQRKDGYWHCNVCKKKQKNEKRARARAERRAGIPIAVVGVKAKPSATADETTTR